ncbi:BatD family protein [Nitrincola alkalilacustris]|uniref:BatD family protein n=1 Tax=Nitrincola alkalilacustris TaxID=1571224 RepID=UPI00124C4181|nr:BatD family protein [Nitrincola alkalilacustris]
MNNLYKQAISYCFLYILLTSSAFAQISAKTDKSSLGISDTVTLMLEIPGADRPLPDLSPLARDFRISSSQRSSIFRHTSGSREASTRWQINLHPLRSGTLTIPALRLNEQVSEPLQLVVSGGFSGNGLSTADQNGFNQNNNTQEMARDAVFFTVELDRGRVYQGAQLLYRASLYHLDPLPESARLTPPQINSGTTREVGPQRRYTDTLDQQGYMVTEQFYALFPHEPGFMEILGASLQTDENSPISARADDLEVEVLPIAHEGGSTHWLPAEQVTLSQDLIQSEHLPGSLLLNVSLSATALGSEQLPTSLYEQAPVEGARLLSRQRDESEHAILGLTGNLRESWLITPAQSGTFNIPALELSWWNTLEDRAQSSSTPATSVEVLLSEVPLLPTQTSGQETTQPRDSFPTGLIIFLSSISLLASLGCLYSFFHFRRRAQTLSEPVSVSDQSSLSSFPAEHSEDSEKEAFDVLSAACLANDAQLSSRALLIWAPRFWPDATIHNLESIGQAAGHQTLSFLILDLEHHLYSDDIDLWQGDLLLEAIKALRKRQRRTEDEDMDIFDLSLHDTR